MKKILFMLVLFFGCQSTNKDYFKLIAENNVKLNAPIEGEWLYSHPEKGQSFDAFTKSNPIKCDSVFNTIYLKPIGTFTDLQTKHIAITKEYLEIFYQINVNILPAISENIVPKTARRIGYESNEQLLAGYILDSILKKEKNKNQIALMAISELDLYPSPKWNFVFGLASYKDKIGVTSIFRFQHELSTKKELNLGLIRLLKISSHEIGHMFAMHHCINAKCVMNGTNSLDETDRSIVRLCSECQRKIHSSFKYDNKKRVLELSNFFKKHNLIDELTLNNLDSNLFIP